MKKLLILSLLISSAMLSQTTAVRGVELTYSKATKTMLLTISQHTMEVDDSDADVRVTINREYVLTVPNSKVTNLLNRQYFLHEGHSRKGSWIFLTGRSTTAKVIKMNYIYQFVDVKPGEYVLSVSDVCDDQWETNQKHSSIIIK